MFAGSVLFSQAWQPIHAYKQALGRVHLRSTEKTRNLKKKRAKNGKERLREKENVSTATAAYTQCCSVVVVNYEYLMCICNTDCVNYVKKK